MALNKKNKKIIVNSLTASRVVGALTLPVIFSLASIPALITLLSILFVTDLLDGKLARKWGVQTKGGALLDPLGDKVLAISCILSFISSYNLLLVPLFFEFGITAINVNRTLHEENVQSSKIGKVKTAILSTTLVLCAINALNPDLLNTFVHTIFGKIIPNIPDLTVTNNVVNAATATTIAAQAVTTGDYIKQSLSHFDERSKKIAELKSAKEILLRLFDETKFEEDKDKSLIQIMKK